MDNTFTILMAHERKAVSELFIAANDHKVFDTREKHQIYLAFQYFEYVQNLGEKLQLFRKNGLQISNQKNKPFRMLKKEN